MCVVELRVSCGRAEEKKKMQQEASSRLTPSQRRVPGKRESERDRRKEGKGDERLWLSKTRARVFLACV